MAPRDRLPYYAYRTGAVAARTMPGPMAASAARTLGLAFAGGMRGRRTMVARHLRRVHGPQLDGVALQRQVQRSFDAYARYWMELFRLPSMTPEEIDARMSYEGVGHLDDALALGNGAILAIPHLGGWDYGGAWFASIGYPTTVVVEPIEPPELFEWFAAYRRSLGVEVVPLGAEAGTAILRRLKGNGTVGLLCDRDLTGGGVEVEFFGERTTLPSGPATLALRTGAPLLPTAVYFDGPRRHRGVIRPPLPTERTGRFRDDVQRITQALAHALEELVRVAPEQWHLFQPNWPSDHEALAALRR